MHDRQRPFAPELGERIERKVREVMESFRLKSVDIRAGADHDAGLS